MPYHHEYIVEKQVKRYEQYMICHNHEYQVKRQIYGYTYIYEYIAIQYNFLHTMPYHHEYIVEKQVKRYEQYMICHK